MEGRKITREQENPFDNIFIDIAEWLNINIFRPLNYTPNMITTMSLFLGVVSVALFHFQYYILSALVFTTAYILDCADGNYARRYNMETSFGDYYDHISDLSKGLLLLIAIIVHPIPIKVKQMFIFFLIVFLSLSLVHLGCQESVYNPDKHDKFDSLSSLKYLCGTTENSLEYIKYTRFFGTGTLIVYLSCLIIVCKFITSVK
jgi:phosphatidylglycerophosphate synthase